MRELSLFSGAGGGLLASRFFLNWTTVGYVEIDDYCQRVIAQRIKDGFLDDAPIFGDIRAFINQGYAARYRGMVDVITAGFPCQPFSVAGKRQAEADDRNQWPNVVKCLCMVRPRYVFLENVPGLLNTEYIWTIAEDLSKAGYDFRWTTLRASDIGGPFKGDRAFFVASSYGRHGKARMGTLKNWTKQIQSEAGRDVLRNQWIQTIERNAGGYNGLAHYMERGRAIGNGQVPRMVANAWEILA